jgi:hypothetical protein
VLEGAGAFCLERALMLRQVIHVWRMPLKMRVSNKRESHYCFQAALIVRHTNAVSF